jgi:hypothetical protein
MSAPRPTSHPASDRPLYLAMSGVATIVMGVLCVVYLLSQLSEGVAINITPLIAMLLFLGVSAVSLHFSLRIGARPLFEPGERDTELALITSALPVEALRARRRQRLSYPRLTLDGLALRHVVGHESLALDEDDAARLTLLRFTNPWRAFQQLGVVQEGWLMQGGVTLNGDGLGGASLARSLPDRAEWAWLDGAEIAILRLNLPEGWNRATHERGAALAQAARYYLQTHR